jgi:4-aminobutyrate aminotransferase-like enzyme
MVYDEVQSGFGRTGKMFCYEHYGVRPDMIACGKGISSSLPLSAVIGRTDIMEIYPPGSMTSTHSASPLCVAAGIASLNELEEKNLVEKSAESGKLLISALLRIQKKYPDRIISATGKGLVGGLRTGHPGTTEPDGETALNINISCYHKGLLMFAPVGVGGECVKIAPPLTITEEALAESIQVLEEAVDEVLGA